METVEERDENHARLSCIYILNLDTHHSESFFFSIIFFRKKGKCHRTKLETQILSLKVSIKHNGEMEEKTNQTRTSYHFKSTSIHV